MGTEDIYQDECDAALAASRNASSATPPEDVGIAMWQAYCAEKERAEMLRDALIEFHDFVSVHLDLHAGPVEDYLAGRDWTPRRIDALRRELADG